MAAERRVLVAGMGNVLTGDDGFGVRVVEALQRDGGLPPSARAIEVGIGGIHLVQELMDGWDALIVVDAVDRGGEPGTVYVLEPRVPGLEEMSDADRRDFLAETHYAVPAKALTLARALAVLPDATYIVGCQPATVDLGIALSRSVAPVVERAAERVRALVADLAGSRPVEPAAAEEATDA